MGSFIPGSDQLTSQTHQQSLSSPVVVTVPATPGDRTAVVETTTASLSPAVHAVADAQPAEILHYAARMHVSSASPPAELYLGVGKQHPGRVWPLYLEQLPNEVLFHILSFLEVNDLLSTSRTSHLFRSLSVAPIVHRYRLRRSRSILPPLLWSPSRPSLSQLASRSIFLTQTSVISRRLDRFFVSSRLARCLAARPSVEALVDRAVLPKECVPGSGVHLAPGIVSKKKAIEKEKVKDGLRRWIATKWRGKIQEREQDIIKSEESCGTGRVWKLRRFWERVARGEDLTAK